MTQHGNIETIRVKVYADSDEFRTEESKAGKWWRMNRSILISHYIEDVDVETYSDEITHEIDTLIRQRYDNPVVLIY